MSVNALSTQLTNFGSQPVILTGSYLTGGNDFTATDNILTGAADGNGSTYRYFKVPSNALINSVAVMNDANTTGTSYKAGLLLPNAGGVIVTGSDAIFIPAGTSMAAARSIWTELYFPAVANNAAAVTNVTKRVWELLGLTSDPDLVYDFAITAVTAGSSGGNMAVRLGYTR